MVRLALGEDLASEPFTRLLFELEHHNTRLELEVRELLHTEAARLVRDRGANVAITLNPRTEPQLKRIRGWSEPLMIVAPIGHTFADREKVGLRELADQTLALPSADECPGYLMQIERLLNPYGVRPRERRNVRHWNTAVSFAATGHAIALCLAHEARDNGVPDFIVADGGSGDVDDALGELGGGHVSLLAGPGFQEPHRSGAREDRVAFHRGPA